VADGPRHRLFEPLTLLEKLAALIPRPRTMLEERDLDCVSIGCVVVTSAGGPALSAVLPRGAGVVADLGGSTSHLAALARERGIPAVLGARGATRRIPEGATVAVDGITGVVRWAR
jgi:rifampicin phosphotransferase